MQHSWRSGIVVLAMAVAFAALLPSLVLAQAKGPEDFTFPDGAQGKVTFSHQKHLAKGEKCTGCHTKIFPMKKGQRGQYKMADMNAGKACGACHDGKVTFSVKDAASCTKCHQKG
ncbi:MAG TPA: cytochrome c3 family protein [Candidatus Sulfotelmatobacter sp.]|nr:cytochrome c3 family protein [Candidatus Sulfotelmatobacter sp.]